MIVVSVAYLMFKEIKRLLAIRNEERMMGMIHLAVSYMISRVKEAKQAYYMLNNVLFSGSIDCMLIT